MPLAERQQLAIDKAKEGKNLWVLGPPGYGKSYLIANIVQELQKKGKKVQVTAMTGAAASLLKDCLTLHRFTGTGTESLKMHLGTFVLSAESLSSRDRKRLQELDVLIIDEAGMLSIDQYNHLDQFLRNIRSKRNKKFGGIQFILVGDPGQLPPCDANLGPGMKRDELVAQCSVLDYPDETIDVIVLNQPQRQADDPVLANVLLGVIDNRPAIRTKANRVLMKHCLGENTVERSDKAIEYAHRTGAIITTPTNAMVNAYINMEEVLLKPISHATPIPDPTKLYEATSLTKEQIEFAGGIQGVTREDNEIRDRNTFAYGLKLRNGQQVKITLNTNCAETAAKCFNGEICRFVTYDAKKELVHVKRVRDNQDLYLAKVEHKTEYEKDVGKIGYYAFPVVAAIAVNIHKIQGQTVPKLIIDPAGLQYFGKQICKLLYVAASRVKKTEDMLFASAIDPSLLTRADVQENLTSLWDNDFMADYPRADEAILDDALA